jgi:hypothetical protein
MRLPVSPFPQVGIVAAPCGYYGFVRLLACPSLPPPVSLGGQVLRVEGLFASLGRPRFPWDRLPLGSG